MKQEKTVMKILKMKMLIGWVAVALVIAFTNVALAGSLEPPSDAVDSSGAPKSTMKTLDNISSSWDRQLDSTNGLTTGCNSDRFTCMWPTAVAFDGAAVRDNETGLVWYRKPGIDTTDWNTSKSLCLIQHQGNRRGWRLPYVEEIFSLFGSSNIGLPDNHPFLLQSGGPFWTTTTSPGFDDMAFAINPGSSSGSLAFSKSEGHRRWCVRGPVSGTP